MTNLHIEDGEENYESYLSDVCNTGLLTTVVDPYTSQFIRGAVK